MLTIDREVEQASSTASTEALELLGCFFDGIDKLVYQMAEQIATKRTGMAQQGRPVQIEVDDVRKAGQDVLQAIQGMVAKGVIPQQIGDAAAAMQNCFQNK